MSTQPISRRSFLAAAALAGLGSVVAGYALRPAKAAPAKSEKAASAASDLAYDSWDDILAEAKGQTVSWYGWGGSEPRNNWIETVLAPRLKEKYDVTLKLVGMDINDILTQLSGEMQAGVEEGSIDFIWINGENFFSTKENGYLWGPFTQYLPNFNDYIDATSNEVLYDFGSETEGLEAPYGKAQMQIWVDSDRVDGTPKNPDEFLEFCQKYEGQVTYPQPGDFTGTAFISSLIAGVIGKEEFEKLSQMQKPTEDEVREIVQPGLDYLVSLNPYLWNKGTTFPQTSTVVNAMYADGELVLSMGYGDPQIDVDNGVAPKATKSFVFETGTVGNSNFMAIAKNASHVAGAMVAINEVMSPEMQLDQYKVLGTLTVLDMEKVPEDIAKEFEAVERKSAQLPIDELLDARVVEAAGPVIPILEKLWMDTVPGK